LASNSDGQWNGTEAAIAVDIDPAFWQTWWFRTSCAAVFLLSVLTFSRVRMQQMKKRLSLSFDERLAERTRRARELHDVLLQTIQGSKIIADVELDEPADSARTRGEASKTTSRQIEKTYHRAASV
jgi:signal transduction histidine kinase